MFSVGQCVTLTISAIAFGGDGVARTEEGPVVFVPFTAVGDVIVAEITEQRRNFYRAELRELVEAGAGREEPRCPHFGNCGGCAYQHLDYATELAAKRRQFIDTLSRLGHFTDFPTPSPTVAAPQAYGYRNKMRLEPIRRLSNSGQTYVNYGYCQRDNQSYLIVKACPLAQDCLNELLPKAIGSAWGRQNAKRPKPYPLTLRVTSNGESQFYYGRAPTNIPWLREELAGEEFSVPLGSFWQVNPPVAEELLRCVADWTKDSPARCLIDAYSGVGTFSIAMDDRFQYRVLIESDEQAIAAAARNHELRQLKCRFQTGNTESQLPTVLAHVKTRETLLILDPPRGGCQPKVMDTLRKFPVAEIVYVSCNPATLARDLRLLCQDGLYAPVKSALFDMFPRTAHFESAVLLRHASAPQDSPKA